MASLSASDVRLGWKSQGDEKQPALSSEKERKQKERKKQTGSERKEDTQRLRNIIVPQLLKELPNDDVSQYADDLRRLHDLLRENYRLFKAINAARASKQKTPEDVIKLNDLRNSKKEITTKLRDLEEFRKQLLSGDESFGAEKSHLTLAAMPGRQPIHVARKQGFQSPLKSGFGASPQHVARMRTYDAFREDNHAVAPVQCPHCEKTFQVASQMSLVVMDSPKWQRTSDIPSGQEGIPSSEVCRQPAGVPVENGVPKMFNNTISNGRRMENHLSAMSVHISRRPDVEQQEMRKSSHGITGLYTAGFAANLPTSYPRAKVTNEAGSVRANTVGFCPPSQQGEAESDIRQKRLSENFNFDQTFDSMGRGTERDTIDNFYARQKHRGAHLTDAPGRNASFCDDPATIDLGTDREVPMVSQAALTFQRLESTQEPDVSFAMSGQGKEHLRGLPSNVLAVNPDSPPKAGAKRLSREALGTFGLDESSHTKRAKTGLQTDVGTTITQPIGHTDPQAQWEPIDRQLELCSNRLGNVPPSVIEELKRDQKEGLMEAVFPVRNFNFSYRD